MLLRALFVICLLSFSSDVSFSAEEAPAVQAESLSKREAVPHYHVDRPPSSEAALVLFHSKMNEISPLFKKKAWTSREFEAVHQSSYYFEAVVDFFRSLKNSSSQISFLDHLDESVQKAHFASEQEEKDVLFEAFSDLQLKAKEIDHVFSK